MVGMRKLILQNRLSPGDILIMSGAIRDLKLAYNDEYLIDVRSPCNEIFLYSPRLTPLNQSDKDVETIDMQYPIIHHSGYTGLHFSDGHRLFLQEYLKHKIPKTSMRPEIFLSQDELLWTSQLSTEFGYEGKYWIVNAGVKSDYPLKWYPYYQEVVDMLQGKVKFVQVGHNAHNHPALKGVLDLRGKTNLRQLFKLSYYAEGALCAVSLQMVIMQAFKKPCVVINGGREGMRWQAINDHVFLHTNGMLNCCLEDGCWKSNINQCIDKDNDVPKCMSIIKPEMVVNAIEMQYKGGRLKYA
jgi:ADP-heptose:LPS heptosyltransferase